MSVLCGKRNPIGTVHNTHITLSAFFSVIPEITGIMIPADGAAHAALHTGRSGTLPADQRNISSPGISAYKYTGLSIGKMPFAGSDAVHAAVAQSRIDNYPLQGSTSISERRRTLPKTILLSPL